MALNNKVITIEKGRDAGKMFVVTEMPVTKADNWAMRAMFALANAGIDIGEVSPAMGMMGIGQVAIKALANIRADVGIPLLNELLDCAQIIPSGGNARQIEMDSDIQDITTLLLLRKEALVIHIGFLMQGDGSDSSN
ncbi:MAG: hypothetical protein RR510_15315 [Morganella sp. (in: enterobacteria)]|uniref:Uncharacterized protein n=1 Tax=Morganella psychrotolerans TaxID=368603 RepID=A0A1B8HSW0_9GAMM|nr:hypothetical protein [Morganella psychrotolerans]OBU12530.1 hypothetical protein AYY18_15465 [Morganella psychrotolerans]HCM64684.1 hypothetical protein [Morganella sp. (in: enterobacteria)]